MWPYNVFHEVIIADLHYEFQDQYQAPSPLDGIVLFNHLIVAPIYHLNYIVSLSSIQLSSHSGQSQWVDILLILRTSPRVSKTQFQSYFFWQD